MSENTIGRVAPSLFGGVGSMSRRVVCLAHDDVRALMAWIGVVVVIIVLAPPAA